MWQIHRAPARIIALSVFAAAVAVAGCCWIAAKTTPRSQPARPYALIAFATAPPATFGGGCGRAFGPPGAVGAGEPDISVASVRQLIRAQAATRRPGPEQDPGFPSDTAGALGRTLNPPRRARSCATCSSTEPRSSQPDGWGGAACALSCFATGLAGEVAPCLGDDEREVCAVRNAPDVVGVLSDVHSQWLTGRTPAVPGEGMACS
jgi:hypothetical protein